MKNCSDPYPPFPARTDGFIGSLLKRIVLLVLVCLVAVPGVAAEFRKGQKVWTKHFETSLLAEPGPLAASLVTLGFAEKLSVRETRGSWLRVRSDEGEGWVFQGNISDEKPAMAPGAGWTTIEASQTDTVAAARPLEPAARDYAQRRDAGEAEADIDWLDAQAALVSDQELIEFMSVELLGEYRE